MIDRATRRVHIAGSTWTFNEVFRAQVGRNLTYAVDGFLIGHIKLIVDRDIKFTRVFQALLVSGGVETIFAPPKSPNCNAFAERFVRWIKEECLRRMIFFGEQSLLRALREFEAHDSVERPQHGVGRSVLVKRCGPSATSFSSFIREECMDSLLRHYRSLE